MSIEIDSLEIEVQASATDASAGINKLTAALSSLKNITKGGAGLTALANQLAKLNTAISSINTKGTSALNAMGSALRSLNGLESVKLSSSIGSQIKAISDAAASVDDTTAQKVGVVANAIRALSGLSDVKVSASIGNQISAITKAAAGVQWTDQDKLAGLAEGIRPLSELGRSNLTSFINQLGKLPTVVAELDKVDMGKFAAQMRETAAAIAPLASEMQKVSNGFAAFPIRIQKIISANTGLAASNKSTAKSFGVMGMGISGLQAKFGIYYMMFKRIANKMAEWVTESNDYVENLNLFNVAMGDATEGAKAYAEEVKTAIGIDPSEWMRNQGLFKQITSGFGVAAEKANLMSKNLTQLGYLAFVRFMRF